LFVETGLAAVLDGLFVGQDAVLNTDHVNHVELQAFTGMQAHEADGVLGLGAVGIGVEADALQVIGDRGAAVGGGKLGDAAEQFIDVAAAVVVVVILLVALLEPVIVM